MQDILKDFREVAGLLCERNWSERNAGNISFRLENEKLQVQDWNEKSFNLSQIFPSLGGKSILITAAGAKMREVKNDPYACALIVEISTVGEVSSIKVPPGQSFNQPSSELLTHLHSHSLLIKHKPEEKAIVHAHVLPLVVLSHHPAVLDSESLNAILLSIHPETMFFLPKGAGFISFDLPGSEELALKTAEGFVSHKLLIWERHGALACGENVSEAFDRLDIASKAASIFLECKNAGYSPKALNNKEIELLKNHYKLT